MNEYKVVNGNHEVIIKANQVSWHESKLFFHINDQMVAMFSYFDYWIKHETK